MNKLMKIKMLQIIMILISIGMMSGCASTKTKDSYISNDAFEPINRISFAFNETFDRSILKPIAESYAKHTPIIYRSSITNFFDNLSYLNVILNSFLQGKFAQFFSDVARFIVNSTIGVAGLNDVATTMGLEEHNEDFGQTLAVWGVGQGSYFYIPLQGPNTIRNISDIATSAFSNPFTYITGAIFFPISALNIVNTRANLLSSTNIRDESAIESYTFTREAYLQQREHLIYDGNPPIEGYGDIFDDIGDDTFRNGSLSIE